jgi:alkanesulfonate monooxygenase SsuD/methylene tetrahydromethanopterin reductase-like flavin-dependent oxidoreductase (luciferase family)
MRAMRFGISIPQFYGDGQFDPDAYRAYFARVEELGFDSAWAQEGVIGASPQLAPLEAMTYAAACTRRMRLGCVVFVSTLDQLSRGRLDVGIGTGGKGRPFAAFGIGQDRYVARFTESLALMKALWTEPRVTFDGEFWQLKDVAMEPKPFQKPYPPVWFGANGELALRRAVRLGDGFFGAGSTPTARFADQVLIVRDALAEAGRSPASFPIAKRLYIGVDADPARARERVNGAMERIYGRRVPDIEAAAVAGTPQDCAREVRAVAEAGAELILFTTVFEPAEQAERLAAEVIPRVSGGG